MYRLMDTIQQISLKMKKREKKRGGLDLENLYSCVLRFAYRVCQNLYIYIYPPTEYLGSDHPEVGRLAGLALCFRLFMFMSRRWCSVSFG